MPTTSLNLPPHYNNFWRVPCVTNVFSTHFFWCHIVNFMLDDRYHHIQFDQDTCRLKTFILKQNIISQAEICKLPLNYHGVLFNIIKHKVCMHWATKILHDTGMLVALMQKMIKTSNFWCLWQWQLKIWILPIST